jgi:hypothetical protein
LNPHGKGGRGREGGAGFAFHSDYQMETFLPSNPATQFIFLKPGFESGARGLLASTLKEAQQCLLQMQIMGSNSDLLELKLWERAPELHFKQAAKVI